MTVERRSFRAIRSTSTGTKSRIGRPVNLLREGGPESPPRPAAAAPSAPHPVPGLQIRGRASLDHIQPARGYRAGTAPTGQRHRVSGTHRAKLFRAERIVSAARVCRLVAPAGVWAGWCRGPWGSSQSGSAGAVPAFVVVSTWSTCRVVWSIWYRGHGGDHRAGRSAVPHRYPGGGQHRRADRHPRARAGRPVHGVLPGGIRRRSPRGRSTPVPTATTAPGNEPTGRRQHPPSAVASIPAAAAVPPAAPSSSTPFNSMPLSSTAAPVAGSQPAGVVASTGNSPTAAAVVKDQP